MVRRCRRCDPFKGRFLYTQDDELLRRLRKAADRMAVDAANQHAGTVATRPSTHWRGTTAAITFKDVT